jgi:hypothetical protein
MKFVSKQHPTDERGTLAKEDNLLNDEQNKYVLILLHDNPQS